MPPSAFRGAPGAGAALFRRQQVFSLREHPFPPISDRISGSFACGMISGLGNCRFVAWICQQPQEQRAPFSVRVCNAEGALAPAHAMRTGAGDRQSGQTEGPCAAGQAPQCPPGPPPAPAWPPQHRPSSTLPRGRLRGTADRPNAKSLARWSRLTEK